MLREGDFDKELDATELLQWYARPRSLPSHRDARNVALVAGVNIILQGGWLYMCPKV